MQSFCHQYELEVLSFCDRLSLSCTEQQYHSRMEETPRHCRCYQRSVGRQANSRIHLRLCREARRNREGKSRAGETKLSPCPTMPVSPRKIAWWGRAGWAGCSSASPNEGYSNSSCTSSPHTTHPRTPSPQC